MPLSNEQQKVFDYIMNHTGGMVFLHGKGGTGKSYLINEIAKYSQKKNVQIVTPTNLATTVYKGARTFHSYFFGALNGLEEGVQRPESLSSMSDFDPRSSSKLIGNIRMIDTLVIDEISMVRVDMVEMIGKVCQIARGNARPFGGIQVVFAGDLFQLPPVVDDAEIEKYLINKYGGIWFFDAPCIKENISELAYFELEASERHKQDKPYSSALEVIRSHTGTGEEVVKAVETINERVISDIEELPDNCIRIAPKNSVVAQINQEHLAILPGETMKFAANVKFGPEDARITGPYTKEYEKTDGFRLPGCFDGIFECKIGARVMFTKSNKKARYKNGQYGKVVDVLAPTSDEPIIRVKLDKSEGIHSGIIVDVRRESDYRYNFEYDEEARELKRIRPFAQLTKQYPLKLGYAITAHKSQGQTYNSIFVDLAEDMFASGLLYVALSRVKTLGGLYLSRPIGLSDSLIEKHVFEFLGKFTDKYQFSEVERIFDELPVVEENNAPGFEPLKDRINEGMVLFPPIRNALESYLEHLDTYNLLYRHGFYSPAHTEIAIILEKAVYFLYKKNGLPAKIHDGNRHRRPGMAERYWALFNNGVISEEERLAIRQCAERRNDTLHLERGKDPADKADCVRSIETISSILTKYILLK